MNASIRVRTSSSSVMDIIFAIASLQPHALAPSLPEPTHCSLSYSRALARLYAAAAHRHDCLGARIDLGRALNEPADAAVLHRDEARRTDQVVVTKPDLQEILIVISKPENRPQQLARFRSARN